MTDAIVDACCFINVYATGELREFLAGSEWTWHISRAALAESLYIRVPTEEHDLVREPIEPKPYLDEGLIALAEPTTPDELELYVHLAAQLDDGEAMALAIAAQRGWTLATDDRKANRIADDLGVAVVTTPELMERWAVAANLQPAQIQRLLRDIELRARFSPAAGAPGYAWWKANMSGA